MKTVLVCDDDIAILDSIEIYLKQEGFNVLKAVDGEEAIALVMKICFRMYANTPQKIREFMRVFIPTAVTAILKSKIFRVSRLTSVQMS